MGFIDKFKNAFSMSEEEYLDDVDVDEEEEEEEEEYVYRKPRTDRHFKLSETFKADNVVDIRSTPAATSAPAPTRSASTPAKAHVVFKRIDTFNEILSVADVLIEQRIVVLNLETCNDDDTRRILDVLSGVAYANGGAIQRVAGRAYVITPNNVPLTGELLDEFVNPYSNNSLF
ncbi:MAG: cell division protein SepF [Clostridia bacterium]|nr:cell division protein SepF [Clostridia bacterium]